MHSIYQLIAHLMGAPFFMEPNAYQNFFASLILDPQGFFDEAPSYLDDTKSLAKKLMANMSDPNIHVTTDFSEMDLPEGAVAYHRIFGTIMADENWWYFSTKQFMRDFKAAENNPKIGAHFLHVKTGGGEAWLLDKAYEMMQDRKKPIIVFVEKYCCSAGLYLACPADKLYSYTQNDTHGSLGTMVGFWDLDPYFIKLGFKKIEEYADKSTLKNKKFNDLANGKPKKYKEDILNPLQEQFETAVRNARPDVNALDENHPVVQGETFRTLEAQTYGLNDGMREIEEAMAECYELGLDYLKTNEAHQRAAHIL